MKIEFQYLTYPTMLDPEYREKPNTFWILDNDQDFFKMVRKFCVIGGGKDYENREQMIKDEFVNYLKSINYERKTE